MEAPDESTAAAMLGAGLTTQALVLSIEYPYLQPEQTETEEQLRQLLEHEAHVPFDTK